MAQDLGKMLNVFSREDEERLAAETAKRFGLPYVNLVGYPIEPKALQVIPQDLAKKYAAVAFEKINNQVRIATPVPENPQFIPFLRQMASTTNMDYIPIVCSKTSYAFAIKQYDFIEPEPPTLEKMFVDPGETAGARGELTSIASIAAKLKSISTSSLLEMVFGGAINLQASDVHIEPEEKEARLRYRIDGMLQDVITIPYSTYRQVANRIKYLSKMQLDTLSKAQDGRFDILVGEKPIDVRVSAIPGAWGEVFVLRLLDQSGTIIDMGELGFSPQVQALINEAIAKPHGVILNTGPTGSGKTTTLYAILQKLNKPEVKIITIEDPIEYRIPGIAQTQVKRKAGYTFAKALKSVLRQDPDIIMVGEIRDRETGETAMQAALTGHLVISTLHTNSAPSAMPRLLDMDVAPFLLSGSINLVMAQRLVRKICTQCKGKKVEQATAGTVCGLCNGTGYKGRVAIAEVLKITPKIEELINKKASVADFEKAARADGMVPMYEDGIAKVRAGITTEEEVLRVTEKEPSKTVAQTK